MNYCIESHYLSIYLQTKSDSIMDSIKLADQHLVGMWPTLFPDVEDGCNEMIVSTDVEIVLALVMYRLVNLCSQTLPTCKHPIGVNLVDVASPNTKAFLAESKHSAKYILPRDLMNEYSCIDFSMKHILVDLATGQPIVHCPDPMHLSKTMVTA